MHPVARLWMSSWCVGGCLGEEGWRPSRGAGQDPRGPCMALQRPLSLASPPWSCDSNKVVSSLRGAARPWNWWSLTGRWVCLGGSES